MESLSDPLQYIFLAEPGNAREISRDSYFTKENEISILLDEPNYEMHIPYIPQLAVNYHKL